MAPSVSFSVLLVLAVFSQASTGALVRSPRESPAPSIQEFFENVRGQLVTLSEGVTKAVRGEEGALTAEDVKTVVEQKTQELVERARAFSAEAARQLETSRGEMSEATAHALQQAAAQVNASVERVQEIARNSPSAVDNFNEAFKSTVESLVDANSRLANAAGDDVGATHDHLANFARNTMSQASDLLRSFASQLSSAANNAP